MEPEKMEDLDEEEEGSAAGLKEAEDDARDRKVEVEPMDEALMNELLLVCSNLGMKEIVPGDDGENHEVFVRGDSCIEWIRDLQRAIRRDDAKNRHVFRTLGSWKVLQNKLLPLFVHHQDDEKLVFAIMKILVMLTMRPDPKSIELDKQREYLASYKLAFCQVDVLEVILGLIEDSLVKTDREEADNLKLELFLMLVRNLLCISEPTKTIHSSSLATAHETFLVMLKDYGVIDIVLSLAEDRRDAREWSLLFIEILHATFGEYTPQDIYTWERKKLQAGELGIADDPNLQRPENDHTAARSTDPLVRMITSERESRKKMLMQSSSRHTNFGFAVSIGKLNGRRMIMTNSFSDQSMNVPQPPRRNLKMVAPIIGAGTPAGRLDSRISRSSLSGRCCSIIKETIQTFIDTCYSNVMIAAQSEIQRHNAERILPTDKLKYFDLAQFCLAFWRYENKLRASRGKREGKAFELEVGPLILNLNEWSWNHVYSFAETCVEVKNYKDLIHPLGLLREMLNLLWEMITSRNDGLRKAAKANIHLNIFQLQERLDFYARLVKCWQIGQFHYNCLKLIVEVTHTVLKIAGMESGQVEVSARRRRAMDRSKKKKKKPTGEGSGKEDEDPASDFESEEEQRQQEDPASDRRTFLFDFTALLRNMISYNTLRMYVSLLSSYYTNGERLNYFIVSFLHRVRNFKIREVPDSLTLAPMLFRLEFLVTYEKILNDVRIRSKSDFAEVLKFTRTVVKDFAELATKNQLLYVEIFMPQHNPRRACERLLQVYEDDFQMSKEQVEEAQITRKPSETLLEKGPEEISSGTEKSGKGSSDEEEHEYNGAMDPVADKPKSKGKVRGGKKEKLGRKRWTAEEDDFIRREYEGLKDLPSVFEILALEDIFQERSRSPEQIARRVTVLGLNRARNSYELDDQSTSKLKKYLESIGTSPKEKYKKAITLVVELLNECLVERGTGGTGDRPLAANAEVQKVLETPKLVKILSSLQLKKPTAKRKEWMVPKDMREDDLKQRLQLLDPNWVYAEPQTQPIESSRAPSPPQGQGQGDDSSDEGSQPGGSLKLGSHGAMNSSSESESHVEATDKGYKQRFPAIDALGAKEHSQSSASQEGGTAEDKHEERRKRLRRVARLVESDDDSDSDVMAGPELNSSRILKGVDEGPPSPPKRPLEESKDGSATPEDTQLKRPRKAFIIGESDEE